MQLNLHLFGINIFPDTGCLTYLLLSAKAGNRLLQICVREYVFKVALTLLCVKVRFL